MAMSKGTKLDVEVGRTFDDGRVELLITGGTIAIGKTVSMPKGCPGVVIEVNGNSHILAPLPNQWDKK